MRCARVRRCAVGRAGVCDCEGLFGVVCKGVSTKPTPRELGPRLEDGEFMDQVRNDAARAQSWAARLSRSAKYDRPTR